MPVSIKTQSVINMMCEIRRILNLKFSELRKGIKLCAGRTIAGKHNSYYRERTTDSLAGTQNRMINV